MCECCGGDCRMWGEAFAGMKALGAVEERVKDLLNDDIFEMLSKHNTYWSSENEQEGDKLDDLRRKFLCIQDNLWDVMRILNRDKD